MGKKQDGSHITMQAVPHYNNNYHYLPVMAITEPRDLNDLIDTAKMRLSESHDIYIDDRA